MNDQNQFYSSISKYYSEIFPYKPIQSRFVNKEIGDLKGKQILDIGCATGELAFQLATLGANVTGIDLNRDLLQQAKEKKYHPKLKFQTGNMLLLQKDFQLQQFDGILCFGNTLVHLESKDLVEQMLNGVQSVLKSGGKFLLQILNYDYILEERISKLPLIETETIKFTRNYKFEDNSQIIRFETFLELKSKGITVSNETSLLALKSEELKQLIAEAGFENINLYSNFKEDIFGGRHLPLVLKCAK